jgi:two-component system response regulator DegU
MILIADDNEKVRNLIRSMIKDLDDLIIEASSGEEAIEAYDHHQPEVVLMDLNMSPVDGLTATKTILEDHPDARIIIVTQDQDHRTRDLSLSVGACGFVGKDDLTELRELLGKIPPASN